MTSQTGGVNAKQARAVPVIAAGGTLDEAADAAGVTPRTITRWRSETAFCAAVRDAQGLLYRDALGVLAGRMRAAATYLGDVTEGREQADHGRINAARLVLTLAQTQREQLELVDRIAALEAVA